MKLTRIIGIIILLHSFSVVAQGSNPVKLGIAGLTHGHVNGILGRAEKGDVEIVGIAEPNEALARRLAERYDFAMDLVYPSLEEMVKATKPEAVAAFNSTYEHLEVVEVCAPLGIHIMVEKPLAVNMKHANKMKLLAGQYGIHLLTNYETTWYPTNHKAYELVKDDFIGGIRKVVIHDGHKGPKEIGVSEEFLSWLTDPKLNGGGALMDFGCYGANLITWMMEGERPRSVMAITNTNKPDIYPDVDDEATIVLQYPQAQVIIQASWNWPFSRKDMEIYGQTGTIFSDNRRDLRFRTGQGQPEQKEVLDQRPAPHDDPFSFFAAVVRGEVIVSPMDLSALENNLIVVEILEAASRSAKTGERVGLK